MATMEVNMSQRTVFEVGDCAGCPFYERGAVNVLVDFLTKNKDKPSGTCRYGAMTMPYPFGRKHIADDKKVPLDCPLKVGDAIVTLRDH